MAYELKELSGSLFKNQKREKDTHPNLQGTALINGVEYWVSGWTKVRQDGDKWISLAFKVKEPLESKKPTPVKHTDKGMDIDSDIPF